jgi:hypothetical protein
MLGMATDPIIRAAVEECADALAAAVLLAARLGADHADLRRAIDRAARALATIQPSPS